MCTCAALPTAILNMRDAAEQQSTTHFAAGLLSRTDSAPPRTTTRKNVASRSRTGRVVDLGSFGKVANNVYVIRNESVKMKGPLGKRSMKR